MSIPRLELMGALISVRLTRQVCKSMEIDSKNTTFWIDSLNVGYWIKDHSRQYKTFAAHRVGEIHASTNPEQWRYVPTKSAPKKITWRLDPAVFSKWYRANPRYSIEIGHSFVRIRSWVQRLVENARKTKEDRIGGELTTLKLINTEVAFIRTTRQEAFPEEMKALRLGKPLPVKSPLVRHTPNLTEGVLRSNTRLRYSNDLSEETKFPIILPKDHPVTKLIVKYYHEKEGHEMGINFTNHLRERYLIINSRKLVKSCVRLCTECRRRFQKRTINQQMAPLPKIRLEKTMRPLRNTAVDYGGPYFTKQGRGKPRQKRYLCLFLCHLEMATSLETDGFRNAFVRMVARRGWLRDALSDNGTNFVMNSRPLTNLSDDTNDNTVITPNHFLIGQMGGELAPESAGQTSFNPRKRRRRVQELVKRVWQRWMKEYLPDIGSRHKWFLPTENLKKNDVVLVIDPQSARRDWGLGRIEATYPGKDGLVRVVDIRQNNKIIRRPITRVSPLEAHEYGQKDK